MTATALTTNGNAVLTLTGPVTLTNFFPRQGTVALASNAALTTAATPVTNADNYSSIGQQAGDSATVTLSGNASLTIAGDFNVGDVSAKGVLNVQGDAAVYPRTFFVGKYGTSTGTVNQTGGTVQEADNGAAPGDWRIGGAGSASDSAAVGIYNLSGGSFSTTSNFQVGAYGHGIFTQTAGTVTVGAYLSIGRFPGGVGLYDMSTGNGTLNASGAPFAIVGEQASGALKIGGTSTINATGLGVGYNNGAVGTVIQTGGTVNLGSNGLQFGTAASSTGSAASGSYTLSGGTLITSSIFQSANSNVTGTFKFNGGTLEPLLNNSSLVPAGLTTFEVQSGAATVNTKGNNTSIFAALTHDPTLGSTPDGGLIKAGTGRLTLGSTESYTGPTIITGGTLDLNGVNQTFTSLTGSTGTALTLGSATLTLKTAATSTYSGIISGGGNLIMAGIGTQILGGADTYTGSTTVQSGTLDLGLNPNNGIHIHTTAGITIGSGARLLTDTAPVAANRALIVTPALSITGSGKLDLANNDMDVTNGSLPSISSEIGTGITSSAAVSYAAHLTALGVIQNNQGGSAIFTAANPLDGTVPGTGDILTKYTYYGDSNLDGKVDGSDYSRIDNGYLANLTGWFNGDFNYDGVVNGSDYTLIDNAFNNQGAAITAQVESVTIAVEVSVPEPASVGIVGLAMTMTMRRRRARDRLIMLT
jgi:fibronectin-binding autotransporter adhesin